MTNQTPALLVQRTPYKEFRTPAPSVHLKIKTAAINGKRRYISRRSHEKIGDCKKSKKVPEMVISIVAKQIFRFLH